ncbi:ankyrin repeat domain-containing protein [Candidatus Micrarchaeota archaeon]|nr:ankyrin repeat domain-containing protein [Candidatus Micrarchaeota archaeon]
MNANEKLWEGSGPKNDIKLVEKALEEDADINMTDGYGKTPLMISCFAGNKKIVKLLLSKSADQFKKDENGRTALFYAAQRGDAEIIKSIFGKLTGAQRISLIGIRDINGEDAAEYAEGFGKKDAAKMITEEKLSIKNSG